MSSLSYVLLLLRFFNFSILDFVLIIYGIHVLLYSVYKTTSADAI